MSPLKFIRTLFASPLPAAIAYFSIMFIGGCLARSEKKPAAITASAILYPGIPAEGWFVKQVNMTSKLPGKTVRIQAKARGAVQTKQK